jgi:hypothetical protein
MKLQLHLFDSSHFEFDYHGGHLLLWDHMDPDPSIPIVIEEHFRVSDFVRAQRQYNNFIAFLKVMNNLLLGKLYPVYEVLNYIRGYSLESKLLQWMAVDEPDDVKCIRNFVKNTKHHYSSIKTDNKVLYYISKGPRNEKVWHACKHNHINSLKWLWELENVDIPFTNLQGTLFMSKKLNTHCCHQIYKKRVCINNQYMHHYPCTYDHCVFLQNHCSGDYDKDRIDESKMPNYLYHACRNGSVDVVNWLCHNNEHYCSITTSEMYNICDNLLSEIDISPMDVIAILNVLLSYGIDVRQPIVLSEIWFDMAQKKNRNRLIHYTSFVNWVIEKEPHVPITKDVLLKVLDRTNQAMLKVRVLAYSS